MGHWNDLGCECESFPGGQLSWGADSDAEPLLPLYQPPAPTCTVIVDHRGRPPFEVLHQVEDGVAEGGVVWVQVDIEGVLVVQRVVFPAQLDVRHLQRVADGLDSIGAGAL